MFGSLHNISAASGEMSHRIYKGLVPHTNRNNLPRDLILRESQAQALRFISEGCEFDRSDDPIGNQLAGIIQLGIFNNIYISTQQQQEKGDKSLTTNIFEAQEFSRRANLY